MGVNATINHCFQSPQAGFSCSGALWPVSNPLDFLHFKSVSTHIMRNAFEISTNFWSLPEKFVYEMPLKFRVPQISGFGYAPRISDLHSWTKKTDFCL